MLKILEKVITNVIMYLKGDWLILLIGILIAVTIKVYLNPNKIKEKLKKNSKLSITGSVAFGAFTPLCACGTMAVILSMFISSMPWGPVIAFLVSSPLTSPSEFLFQTSFLNLKFAISVLISSLTLGIGGGYIAHYLDKKTNFFKNQFRLIDKKNCCSNELTELTVIESCCTKEINKNNSLIKRLKIKEFIKEFIDIGLKKVLLYFIIFISIGQLVEILVPMKWISLLFGSDKSYSIILSATIGLPLYVSGPSALPLLNSLLNSGASEGAILAFLITGKATGVPVIAGMASILKKRAILFYVGLVFLGGIISGYLFQVFNYLLIIK